MAGELPLPTSLGGGLGGEQVKGPGVSSGGIDFGASSWQRLAQSGDQLAKIGTSTAELAHADRLRKELGDNAELELKANKDYVDMRIKYDNDPQGFTKASQEYRKAGAAGLTGEQQKHFLKVTAGHEASGYGTLALSQHSREQQKADTDITNLMKDNSDKALTAAAEGAQPGDPALDKAIADYEAQYALSLKSPRLAKETLAANRQNFYNQLRGNAVGASAGKIYSTSGVDELGNPYGGYKRAREYLDGAIADLPADQREQARVAGQKVLNTKRTRSNEDFEDLKVEAEDYKKALENGIPIDRDGAQKLSDDLWRRGHSKEASELDYKLKTRLQVPAGLTPAQQQGALSPGAARHADRYARTAAEIGMPVSWVAAIGDIESSHKEYAQDPGSSYSGLFQLSQKEFRDAGGKGSIYDADENAKAFAVIAKQKIAAFTAKYGHAPSPGEFYMLHQQGEGGAAAHFSNPQGLAWQNFYSTAEGQQKGVGYSKAAIRGNLPDSLKPYAETMTSEQFTNYWINRVNRGISRESIMAGGGTTDVGAATRPSGSPPSAGGRTPGQVAADQEAFVERAKTAWEHNGKANAVDNQITEGSWATYEQAGILHAQKTGDDKFLRDVMSTKYGVDIVQQTKGMDPAQRQNYLAQLLADAERRGAAGPTVTNGLKWAQEQFAAENKVAKEDPVMWAVRYRGATPAEPLTPDNEVAFARQLGQRARHAQFTSQQRNEPLASALNSLEAESVKAQWNAADIEGKARMLASMRTALVPPDGATDNRIYEQTLEKIGLDTPTHRAAGLLAKTNPNIAKEILYAEPVVSAKGGGNLSPKVDDALNTSMNSKIGTNLYPRPQDQNDLREAARTLAIKRQMDSRGGLYTEVDEGEVTRAVNDVFGNTISINKKMIAAPPGRRADQAWNAWQKIDVEQLGVFGGAHSFDGQPLDINFVRDHAVLQQASPRSNLYYVGIPDPNAAAGGVKPVLTFDASPLVVDLNHMIANPGQGVMFGRGPGERTLGERPAGGSTLEQRERIRQEAEQRGQPNTGVAVPGSLQPRVTPPQPTPSPIVPPPVTPAPTTTAATEPSREDKSIAAEIYRQALDPNYPGLAEGQLARGNIDLSTRPIVQTEDGRPATVRSIGIEVDGKHIVIPTVVNGKIVSNEEAIARYNNTGENLGMFTTQARADEAAKAISKQEGERIAAGPSNPNYGRMGPAPAQRFSDEPQQQQAFNQAVFQDLKTQFPERTDGEIQAMLDAVNASMSKSRAHFFPSEAMAVNAGAFEERFGPQGSAPSSTNIEDIRDLSPAEQEAYLRSGNRPPSGTNVGRKPPSGRR